MIIRASMLPAYSDCPRRAAARQFRRMVERAGFALRQTLPSIGAAVGTTVHAVIEAYFRARLDGTEFKEAEAVDAAMTGLQEEVAPGCVWDDSTPSVDVARQQVRRMAAAYIYGSAADIVPLAVEMQLGADLGEDWKLTGRVDLLAAHPDGGTWLRDFKTGAVSRSHHAQLGAYSLLVRSDPPPDIPADIKAATIDFIKRTPRTRPQDAPVSTDYPVPLCERTAWATIKRIRRDVQEFQETGNPEAFAENPMSMMCGDKYCPAWGTAFCPITQQH